jgi:hypothetical protein
VSVFNINLVTGDVLPRKRRAALFWGMVLYLMVCGAVLALIAYQTTRSFVKTSNERDSIRRSEDEFKELHLASGDLDAGLQQLREQLDRECMRLTVIDGILEKRTNMAVILAALSQGLPPDLYILNVASEEKKKTLTFDLVIPVGKSIGSPNASELIAHWTGKESLMREVSTIRSLVSERQRIGGNPVFLLKFECRLRKGSG